MLKFGLGARLSVRKLGVFALAASWILVLSSAAHATIPAAERAALIALYDGTNGGGWRDNTGWKAPPLDGDGFAMPGTECGWVSVWCDGGETTVQELDLDFNLLSGSIPPELEDLSNLQYLLLSNNQLSGVIPPELGNLSNLLELSLYHNDLTGSIPPELGDLADLEILWLDGNDLTGSIPPELGDLSNLQHLFLFNNQLSGVIPPELGNLAGVEALFLNGNQLSGSIPPELGSLSALLYIYLDDNELVGPVPVEMMDLTSLLDDSSDFCNNHLYTSDSALSSFLDTKQIGGDWKSCQTPISFVPSISFGGLVLLAGLVLGSAAWARRGS